MAAVNETHGWPEKTAKKCYMQAPLMSGQVHLHARAGTEGGGAIASKFGGVGGGGGLVYLFMGYFVHLYILPLLKFNIIGKTGWQQ